MKEIEPPDEAGPQEKPPGPEKQKSAALNESLPASLDEALQKAGLNPQNPEVSKTLAISLSMMMASGSLPLPPPAVLSDYNKDFPGLVERIVSWTEDQRKHRMAHENLVTNGAEARMNRGQLIAAGVAFFGLSLSALVGIVGNPYVAAVIAIVSIGGPTAAVYLARGDMTPRLPASSRSNPPKDGPPGGQR